MISHVKEIFNDDHEENIYFATIPAIVKRGNTVQLVQRIWLGQYERMKTSYRNKGTQAIISYRTFGVIIALILLTCLRPR